MEASGPELVVDVSKGSCKTMKYFDTMRMTQEDRQDIETMCPELSWPSAEICVQSNRCPLWWTKHDAMCIAPDGHSKHGCPGAVKVDEIDDDFLSQCGESPRCFSASDSTPGSYPDDMFLLLSVIKGESVAQNELNRNIG
eukprot:GHVH01011438.1.p1 GENE.GHVH01011438.1~~GHVH01011438.1.p1  ORF type:complete len:140 (-),score=23.27 GHVH01011438.1:1173-1592(-)